MPRFFAAASLACAAILFALLLYVFGNGNSIPVSVPLPGPERSVSQPFELKTKGSFRLAVAVPLAPGPISAALAELPPVDCNLSIAITGPQGHTHQTVTSLQRGAQFTAGRIDYYYAPSTFSLPTGEYEVTISNHARQPFGDSGAMLTLERREPLTETQLLVSLMRFTAWATLWAGILILVFDSVIRLGKRMKTDKAQGS